MATVISAPVQNSILNDANTTEIIIEDNATNYLNYGANIYINGFIFDRVIMPKMTTNSILFSNNKMILSFSNLLLKYLNIPTVEHAFVQPFNMINNLTVEIIRMDLQGYPHAAFTFNYKLKYSQYPTIEKYEAKNLAFIAVDADTLLVQPNTLIQLPVYTNDPALLTTVEAVTEDNTVLATYTTNGPMTSKTMLFSLEVNAPDNVNAYFFRIKAYSHIISKKIRVVRHNFYKPKRVRFYNRFGMPVLVELFGKLSAKDEHTYLKYQNGLGIYNMAEVLQNRQITIDTGYLLDSEKAIVNQIVSSLNVQIEINGVFIPCVATLKTVPVINENEFINGTQLTFEFNLNPKHKN